jgi:hypothetical protein
MVCSHGHGHGHDGVNQSIRFFGKCKEKLLITLQRQLLIFKAESGCFYVKMSFKKWRNSGYIVKIDHLFYCPYKSTSFA